MQIGSKNFLTEEELAKQIGKSMATLRWWRRDGHGPAWTKLGQTPVYDQADVEAWVESLKRNPRARVAA